MIDVAVAWATSHPMNALGLMVGIAVIFGLAGLSPEIRRHIGGANHPRC